MKCLLLDENNVPYPVDVDEWIAAVEIIHNTTPWPWQVARDDRVSTVFLGYDAVGGPFETLYADDDDEVKLVRYETWADAEAGHRAILEHLP